MQLLTFKWRISAIDLNDTTSAEIHGAQPHTSTGSASSHVVTVPANRIAVLIMALCVGVEGHAFTAVAGDRTCELKRRSYL